MQSIGTRVQRVLQHPSSGALALPGHLEIAALPLHVGGRASGVHPNAEHWYESATSSAAFLLWCPGSARAS